MTQAAPRNVQLAPHPADAAPLADDISVAIVVDAGELVLRYVLSGDLTALHLPAPSVPARGERLWAHTCCEVFIATDAAPDYLEFNFSPSGQWAAYAFSDYREGGPAPIDHMPCIRLHRDEGRLELAARIPADALALLPPGPLRLGLAVIVEGVDGEIAHWALVHPPGRPDFHNPEAFAFALEAHATAGKDRS